MRVYDLGVSIPGGWGAANKSNLSISTQDDKDR